MKKTVKILSIVFAIVLALSLTGCDIEKHVENTLDKASSIIDHAMENQEEILDSKKRQKIILNAIDELPKDLRNVIYWFEFEELTYEEIAKKTKVPVGTIKSRLFNARKALSKKLAFLQGE